MSLRNRLTLLTAGIGLIAVGRRVLQKKLAIQDKVVLITGGSRGLGLAVAEEFAAQGAKLVICARNEQELQQAQKHFSPAKTAVLTVQCDVTDHDQVQQLIEKALNRFGQIDIVVNNAGIISAGPVRTLTREDFAESMNVIFWGTYNTSMAVLPHMLARKQGSIVNITSIGGKVSVPHLLSYSSAKFAAVGFSEGLRAELAREGIRVITIAPGLMRTGSHINTVMKGKTHRVEYTLFTLLDTLPFTSISAKRAAQQIVAATRRGSAEIVISIQAQLATRFHGLFPGTTADILSVVNRLLPSGEGAGTERHTGKESETPISRSFITALGQQASQRYNEHVES
ncbi:MAG: SDR family NAD(P)-dependent oxidoreductase [Ktedonobacteraceae bacterium]